MTLGLSRPRNDGRDHQLAALLITLHRCKVAFQVRKGLLFVAGCNGSVTLPFNEAYARLHHPARGRWEARALFDDALLVHARTETNVIRACIEWFATHR